MTTANPSRRWRSVVGWNVLFLSACAALIFIDWEAWFHMREPFTEPRLPTRFEPGVGLLNEPGAEARWTNRVNFWVAQRANRWGFLDREPLSPEQAAQTCHIAFLGDSFVEAKEVSVAEKFHVRLEELAALALPQLDITTSAFGRNATGQINQLPFYDAYARRLRPKLVVLVFVRNDFKDNHKLVAGIITGWDPDQAPYAVADKTATGALELRPPDPAWRMLPISSGPPEEGFWALGWLRRKTGRVPTAGQTFGPKARRLRTELLAQRPRYQAVIEASKPHLTAVLPDPPTPLSMEVLEFTAFALDEFQRRVAADGASLWLLLAASSVFPLGDASDPHRVVIEDLAEARGIPVVSLHDYLVRQGLVAADGTFPFDGHWNPTGHRWVAEALLERLRQGPEVCGTLNE